ncbi:SMC-Scp complex subunit ScpB [Rubrivirga sp.]|uniref:SMC-Scp complex subunit ScpB n=1 Tax=Rubrivirga sp. TaxID=1885344 RepID=UPI003B52FDF2
MEPRYTSDTLDQAVEALVFASDVPLRPDDVARAYGEVTGVEVEPGEVERAVGRLNGAYRQGGRAFRIQRWAGGLRMATVEEVHPFVRALFEQDQARRLSRSLLETLAVIAYKQPVTRPEVDHVRGVNSDYALRQLLERDFVAISGRGEGVGRPLLYATTDRFLDQFGLDGLGDLPTPREIDEILADPAFNRERASLLAELATPPTTDVEADA